MKIANGCLIHGRFLLHMDTIFVCIGQLSVRLSTRWGGAEECPHPGTSRVHRPILG